MKRYKKYGKKRKKVNRINIHVIIIAIVLIIVMSIGYARFSDTLTMHFSANVGSFTITYHLGGGTNVANPITSYDATTNAPLPIPTQEGYIFGGWYENDQYTGNSISTTPTGSNVRNLNLYAKWVVEVVPMEAEVGGVQYATIQEAVNTVPTTDTETIITILKNVELSQTISIAANQNIKFNIQNYVISNVNNVHIPIIENYGTLKIINGTISTSATQGAINVEQGGTLLMSGGQILTTNNKQAIYNNGGTVEISGTAYLKSTSNVRATVQNQYGGILTITGGTIISTRYAAIDNAGTLAIGVEDGDIDLESPIIQGFTYGITRINATSQSKPEFSFYDGVVRYKTDFYNDQAITLAEVEGNKDLFYSTEYIDNTTYDTVCIATPCTLTLYAHGGTISTNSVEIAKGKKIGNSIPAITYTGYEFDGWFTAETGGTEVTSNTIVTADMELHAHWTKIYLAEINGTQYDTVADAISHAPNNTQTTITILRDIAVTSAISIPSNKNIILDINSYTLSNYNNADTPVIQNFGTLQIINGTITSNAKQGAINNKNGGRMTISGGRIIATGLRQAVYNETGGTLEVTGTAYLESVTNERATLQNLTGGTVRITGGTIVSINQQAVKNEGTMEIGVKDGNVSVTSPSLQGATYGLTVNAGTCKFYDGEIKGVTGAISGNIAEYETDYTKAETLETISGTTYHKAYLIHN